MPLSKTEVAQARMLILEEDCAEGGHLPSTFRLGGSALCRCGSYEWIQRSLLKDAAHADS